MVEDTTLHGVSDTGETIIENITIRRALCTSMHKEIHGTAKDNIIVYIPLVHMYIYIDIFVISAFCYATRNGKHETIQYSGSMIFKVWTYTAC